MSSQRLDPMLGWLRRGASAPPGPRVAAAAISAIAALGLGYWVAREAGTPYLANLAIDASSSVLSPGGLSSLMELVGELGKAATFAGVLTLQFVLYVLVWTVGSSPSAVPASAGRVGVARDVGLRLAVVAVLVMALAGFLALAADTPPLRGWEWGELAWHTLAEAAAFVGVAQMLSYALPGLAEARPWSPRATTLTPEAPADGAAVLSRRQFLRVTWVMGAGAASVAAAWYLGRSVAATARTGVLRSVNGLWSPEVTPTEDFYVVSKNIEGFDPEIALESWALRVDGMVREPLTLRLADLQAMPATTGFNTLMCISYRVGGELISNASWTGVSLRDVLERAGVDPGAGFVKFTSADEYTESLPLEAALDPDVRLVWLMNGEPLTRKHGYPLRALVPGRYGMKNPKWITGLTVQADEPTGYWAARGWSRTAFVRTMSRFDVPGRNDTIAPGRQPLRGVAFAGDRGISRVEVSTDRGETWADARVHPPLSDFSWVRWEYDFDAETPRRVLYVRATDGEGRAQIAEAQDPLPEGATGLHRRPVTVREPDEGAST